MKTLTVLTDFSPRSENAAIYALHMAASIDADILLFHAFELPVAESMGMPVAWPPEVYDEFRDGAVSELSLQAKKLETLLALTDTAYKPKITYQFQDGPLFLQLEKLFSDRNNLMLVMGSHKKGLSGLIGGNHMAAVMEGTNRPVLIVPENAVYSKLCKIGFATDLSHSDIAVISSLTTLATHTKAEIMLAHIHAPTTVKAEPGEQVRNFLEEVAAHINYPKVYYRSVEEEHLQEGLSWLSTEVSCHILVMVHREKTFLENLFGKSHTGKFATETRLPLLIYPDPATHLPVF